MKSSLILFKRCGAPLKKPGLKQFPYIDFLLKIFPPICRASRSLRERKFRDIVSRSEGSHRGLVRLLGKQVWEKSHREFESRPLRQLGNEVIGSPRPPRRPPRFWGSFSSFFFIINKSHTPFI